MRTSRILAVDHVHLEAPPGLNEALVWFYSEVAELEAVGDAGPDASCLCFKSARIELRIAVRDDAYVESVACRARILVPSLLESMRLLEERRVEYEPLCGLTFTDRRIAVHDPAGNRVELKQEWPLVTL